MRVNHLVGEARHGVTISHVHHASHYICADPTALLLQGLKRFRGDVADCKHSPFMRQGQGHGPADPAARTRNNRQRAG